MADAMRAMLDELMGANRNGDRPDAVISDFRDERLCRQFMCGFCICEQVGQPQWSGSHPCRPLPTPTTPLSRAMPTPTPFHSEPSAPVAFTVCPSGLCLLVVCGVWFGSPWQFENTKDAPGKCPYTHDVKMKAEYVHPPPPSPGVPAQCWGRVP